MAFRANFLFFWLCCNGAYFFVILNVGSGSGDTTVKNSGTFGALEIFSLYLAGIVVFRVFFATLHTCKWKWRFCCSKKYRIESYNLEKAFRKLKKESRTGGESTDDEQMEEEAEKIFAKNEAAITAVASRVGIHDVNTYEGRVEAALEFAHDNAELQSQKSDSDEEMLDFVKADLEEVEDNLVKAYRKSARPLN